MTAFLYCASRAGNEPDRRQKDAGRLCNRPYGHEPEAESQKMHINRIIGLQRYYFFSYKIETKKEVFSHEKRRKHE